ncbi:MAG: chemotaxis protein CheW [Acidobacteriota bacterium]
MSRRHLRRLMPLTVAGHRLLIDASQVAGVDQNPQIQRNPASGLPHGWLLGSQDGIAVVDLAQSLELGRGTPGGTGTVVVLSDADGEPWGCLVDSADDALQISEEEIRLLDEPATATPFSALVDRPGGARLLLDAKRIRRTNDDPQAGSWRAEAPSPTLPTAGRADAGRRMVWIPARPEGRTYFGLSARQFVEIRDPLPITPLPGPPRVLAGLVAYEHRALPVANLDWLLGKPPTKNAGERLLIVRGSRTGHPIALPVAADIQLVELPVAHRSAALEPERAAWIRGAFEVEEGLLLIPDLDEMLHRSADAAQASSRTSSLAN